jgi:hypothetical protein
VPSALARQNALQIGVARKGAGMIERNWDHTTGSTAFADWRPAHAPTCRTDGCGAAPVDGSEWCEPHLRAVTARRAYVAWLQESPDRGPVRPVS